LLPEEIISIRKIFVSLAILHKSQHPFQLQV
jgi:hypothetical protein